LKVKWVSLAIDDLENIDDYISKDSQAAAHKVFVLLWETVALLVDHPHIGRPGRVHGTRELVIPGTPFIIPYRIVADEIQILRVLHGARKWPHKI